MNIQKYILTTASAVVLLTAASCVKDSLNDTPHPDKGAVLLMFEGAAADTHTVLIDDRKSDFTSLPFCFPALLEPGSHTMTIWNHAEGFDFDGLTARVKKADSQNGEEGDTPLIPMPGHLYSTNTTIEVMADDTLRIQTPLTPRTRDLVLQFTVTEGRPELIQSVTGTIDGIANAFSIENGEMIGAPASTVVSFTRDGDQLHATARILGTRGSAQSLTFDIVFVDGERTQRTEVDLTEALAGFNSPTTEPFPVRGNLNTPIGLETGSAEIIGWEEGDGGDLEAGV